MQPLPAPSGRRDRGCVMAITKTTRRGNGAGWGGPASGVGSNSKAGTPGPGRPKGMKPGEGKLAQAREYLQSKALEHAMRLNDIAMDPTDPRSVQAINIAMTKAGLADKQEIEHIVDTVTPEERQARIDALLAKRAGHAD